MCLSDACYGIIYLNENMPFKVGTWNKLCRFCSFIVYLPNLAFNLKNSSKIYTKLKEALTHRKPISNNHHFET